MVEIEKPSMLLVSLVFSLFLSLAFLTPYGFSIGEEVIWANDIVAVAVTFLMLMLMLCRKVKYFVSYQVSIPIVLILSLFLIEMVLPLVGIFIWNNAQSSSSSIRAIIYWMPLLILFFCFNPNQGRVVSYFDKFFILTIVFNFLYGLVELAIYKELLPQSLNFRIYLQDFAPQERFLNNRVMSFGFFQNSTAYGVYGFIAFSHFVARVLQIDSFKMSGKFYFFALLSFFVIILSTSRVPFIAAVFVSLIAMFFLGKRKENLLPFLFALIFIVFGSVGVFYVDIELFSRYARLLDGGLTNDYSLGQRLEYHWPNALDHYRDLGHPYFTNPTAHVGLIDSGYLSYLLQGGWLTLAFVIFLSISLVACPLYRAMARKGFPYFNFMLAFLGIYFSFGMVISNPARNPILIAFICYTVFGFSKKRWRF